MEGEVTPNQSLANGPTGCWRQSQTPAWNHRMASAWGKAAASFCPGDDITMCRPCLPWDRFWQRSWWC